jgi:phage repressor protein C with HTH and peptisase S24 domain
MLKHADVWRALDRLAAKYGLSASGLARRAGLDPTTFNKSKRTTKEGKHRWPSTESLAKVLTATGASLAEFVGLMGEDNAGILAQRLPLIGFSQAGRPDSFDEEGRPAGNAWDEALFPHLGDPNAYALEVSGDAMAPVYRNGDMLVVSPDADIRRGDRIVLRSTRGEVVAGRLLRESARRLELAAVNESGDPRTFDSDDVAWVVRILWASQ